MSNKTRKLLAFTIACVMFGFALHFLEWKIYAGVMLAVWGNQIASCIKDSGN